MTKAEQHDMLVQAISPMAIDEVEWLRDKLDAAMNPSSAAQWSFYAFTI